MRKFAKNRYFNFFSRPISSWKNLKEPQLDTGFLCNPKNLALITDNILKRKGVGDIQLVNELNKELAKVHEDSHVYRDFRNKFNEELLKIPNLTHPAVLEYGEHPKLLKTINDKKQFPFKQREFHEITKRLNLVRTEQLGNVSGNRSYYILGEMAELEHALLNYFMKNLMQNGFEFISVPDILPRDVIEKCGMNTKGERNQVYTLEPKLHGPDLCLSGTSEMSLAGYLAGETFQENELPKKLAAVSRCYRAETSSVAEERGIFRVHEFTKVEMFMVSTPDASDSALEDIRILQEENFKSLGLHCQVLDMPAHELGAQAYRKYDIEAWMSGRKMYGEISSCSNCTDYQSRRLNIKYESKEGLTDFVHTLNGTACAIPRLLIALTEHGQDDNGFIHVPEVLQEYMDGKAVIGRQKKIPELKLVKNKK
ncbi:unnamed protein product [Phaedon cochleariae]|uniref:serine--tRNA ligase n=1 Tax=Phaedon cochleariae TaxID=80249 RepID=A0A9P0GPL8_PHACE|nr:unnamed protein product [Phaedon cochleariae]